MRLILIIAFGLTSFLATAQSATKMKEIATTASYEFIDGIDWMSIYPVGTFRVYLDASGGFTTQALATDSIDMNTIYTMPDYQREDIDGAITIKSVTGAVIVSYRTRNN